MGIHLNLKNKLRPASFILAGFVFGVILTAIITSNYQMPSKIASFVNFKPSPSPEIIEATNYDGYVSPDGKWVWSTEKNDWIPNPKNKPSEKALKIASFFVVRSSESYKKEKKIEYGVENESDTKLIETVALKWDLDNVLLTEKEALMEKTMAQESKPVVNVEQPSVNVQTPSAPKNCISSKIGNSVYTNCY